MKEYVGVCAACNKEINCLDGFLNGIVRDNGELLCFTCQANVEDSGSD